MRAPASPTDFKELFAASESVGTASQRLTKIVDIRPNLHRIRIAIQSTKGEPRTMTSKLRRLLVPISVTLFVIVTTGHGSAPAPPPPNPILYITGIESFQNSGKTFLRYRYDVFNKDAYPADFFAAAPQLPPCGKNTKAARTWVDIYDQSGKRLQGFCAFAKPADLGTIWFALEEGAVPPSWVYVELTDRQTNTKYKSNLAETSL